MYNKFYIFLYIIHIQVFFWLSAEREYSLDHDIIK